MELKQLQSLVAISEHGSFSGAAKALDTVQSNISAHIARLEKELGAQLIERSTGILTEEGELVLSRARRILHEVEDIDADVHSLGSTTTGDCRLGALGTTARWLMPSLLGSIARHHPSVRTTIVEGSTSSLLPRIRSGEIDAAIVHLPIADTDLDATELFSEELFVIAPKTHALATYTTVSIEELTEHRLLLAPRGTASRRILDKAAASKGLVMQSQAEIDGVRLMASLVYEGFGAAIVPASAIPSWLQGNFVRISISELPQRVVGWVQRPRPRPNRATLAVRDRVIHVIGRHAPNQPGISLLAGAKTPK